VCGDGPRYLRLPYRLRCYKLNRDGLASQSASGRTPEPLRLVLLSARALAAGPLPRAATARQARVTGDGPTRPAADTKPQLARRPWQSSRTIRCLGRFAGGRFCKEQSRLTRNRMLDQRYEAGQFGPRLFKNRLSPNLCGVASSLLFSPLCLLHDRGGLRGSPLGISPDFSLHQCFQLGCEDRKLIGRLRRDHRIILGCQWLNLGLRRPKHRSQESIGMGNG
jgi:hypothetical protein